MCVCVCVCVCIVYILQYMYIYIYIQFHGSVIYTHILLCSACRWILRAETCHCKSLKKKINTLWTGDADLRF